MDADTFGKIIKFATAHYTQAIRPDNDMIRVYAIQLMPLCPVRLLRAVNVCVQSSQYFPSIADILAAYWERPSVDEQKNYEKRRIEYERRWTAQKRMDPYARYGDAGAEPQQPFNLLPEIDPATARIVLGDGWARLALEDPVKRISGECASTSIEVDHERSHNERVLGTDEERRERARKVEDNQRQRRAKEDRERADRWDRNSKVEHDTPEEVRAKLRKLAADQGLVLPPPRGQYA